MGFSTIVNKYVCDVPVYEPGRPIAKVARELGLKPASIIKLASNENALGPSISSATEVTGQARHKPAFFAVRRTTSNRLSSVIT